MNWGPTRARFLFYIGEAPGRSLPELVKTHSAKNCPWGGVVRDAVRWGLGCIAKPRKRVAQSLSPRPRDAKKAPFALHPRLTKSELAGFPRNPFQVRYRSVCRARLPANPCATTSFWYGLAHRPLLQVGQAASARRGGLTPCLRSGGAGRPRERRGPESDAGFFPFFSSSSSPAEVPWANWTGLWR